MIHGYASVTIDPLMMDSIRVTKKAIGWSLMKLGSILYTYVAFAEE
jgi:hypothetical protein